MRPVPVVLVYPRHEMVFSFGGVRIGAGVGPFVEGGLDEAFGLAVGARGVGPGTAVLEADLTAPVGEGVGAIADAVIGQDGLEVDAVVLVEGQRRAGSAAPRRAFHPGRWRRRRCGYGRRWRCGRTRHRCRRPCRDSRQ